MYVVDDVTFRQARSIIISLAQELSGQEGSRSAAPVDLRELVRQSAELDLPAGGEAAYLSAVAGSLERLFPIEELFPRKRRPRDR